jgi:hypothetical protein
VQLDELLPPALCAVTADATCRSALLRVLSAAEAMTGNRDRAVELLLREPLRTFDGQMAVDLVIRGRVSDVLAYLESLSGGAAG